MKRWIRLVWVILTNVAYAVLMSSRALETARLKQLLASEPTSLWVEFFRGWRLYPGAFVGLVWLGAGLVLEVTGARLARYVNISFYVFQALKWTVIAVMVVLTAHDHPEDATGPALLLGLPAFIVAVADWWLYREGKQINRIGEV